jgi:hypothetical protein
VSALKTWGFISRHGCTMETWGSSLQETLRVFLFLLVVQLESHPCKQPVVIANAPRVQSSCVEAVEGSMRPLRKVGTSGWTVPIS